MRASDSSRTRARILTVPRLTALALPVMAWLLAASLAAAQAQQPPAGARAVPPPLPPPQFAGRWDLNVQASDPTPAWEQQEGAGQQDRGSRGEDRGERGERGGRGGMGGRRGMSGERGRAASPKPDSPAARQQMERALGAPRFLIIVQHPDHLIFTDDEGRVTALQPDGAKVAEQQAGESVERTTTWNDRALVTTTKLANGAKVIQTFTKVFDGLQLVVVTRIEGGRLPRPIDLKRVYDQALQ